MEKKVNGFCHSVPDARGNCIASLVFGTCLGTPGGQTTTDMSRSRFHASQARYPHVPFLPDPETALGHGGPTRVQVLVISLLDADQP